jgi:ribose-phosphate pyrophosphokinase
MMLLNGKEVEFKQFPNGETLVPDDIKLMMVNRISFKYENDSDLIKLMLLKKFMDGAELPTVLDMYYMPYSRMDRSEEGSVFTLKYIANFINDLNFAKVKIVEPHSDVTTALVDRSVAYFSNFDLLQSVMNEVDFHTSIDYLFFPDAGAQKRYHRLAQQYRHLVGYKHRDFGTGNIGSLQVVGDLPNQPNKIIIVDDLSSYGTTFIKSAEKLREIGFKEIYLLVTHAENSIFKKHGGTGKILVQEDSINKIFTTDTILTDHKANWFTARYENKLKVYSIEDLLR